MRSRSKTYLAACLIPTLIATPCPAQSYMGRVMKKGYSLRLVSCAACHPKEEKEKEKDVLTPFGVQIAGLVAEANVTERLDEAEESGTEEVDRVEEELEKEFLDVLEALQEQKTPTGKSYYEAIRAGEIDGIKPRASSFGGPLGKD